MTAIPYPSGSQYVEALQNPGVCFKDEKLKRAHVQLDKLGRPRPISGNFASVFALTTSPNDEKLAIKCFTRNIADQEKRYRAVSSHLVSVDEDWKVGFEYEPQSILVGGRWYPTVQMRWAEGTSLIRWIDGNSDNRERMTQLAHNFVALIESLEAHGLAHGDLQHGNILVAQDCSLRLVDYDGMFVPALSSLAASEQGHRNYQPPKRSNEFHARIDRFSAWVIYLSLAAVAEQPSLWSQLRSPDGEYLLLAEEDFKDPAGSSRFPSLLNHGSPPIRDLSRRVLDLVQLPTTAIPQLEAVELGHQTLSPAFERATSPSGTGRPAWMLTHLNPPSAPPIVSFSRRSKIEITFFLLMPLVASVLAVSVLSGLTTLAVAIEIAITFMPAWVVLAYVDYRRRPEFCVRSGALKRRSEVRQQETVARQALKASKKMVEDLEKAERKRVDQLRVEREGLQKDHQLQVEEADRGLQKKMSKLSKESAVMVRKRQEDLSRALEEEQQAHIVARLHGARLDRAKLSGIGPKVVSSLSACGISTAADFTGVRRIQSGQKSIPLIVLRSGSAIKVPNIGDVKASTLDAWRRANVDDAMRTMPRVLSEATRISILNRHAAVERQLADAQDQATKDMKARKVSISQHLSMKLAELSVREGKGNAVAAQTRAQLGRDHASAQSKLEPIEPLVAQAELDLRSVSSITFRRFLVFGLFG